MTHQRKETIGDATLHLGNCLDVLPGIPGASVGLVLTDPPYLAHYRSRDGRGVPNDDNDRWLKPAFAQMHRVLRPDSFAVSFYGWPHADRFLAAFREAGFRVVGHFAFPKRYASSARYLRYQHENAYLLAKGNPRLPDDALGDVIEWEYSGNRLHPTQKPLGVLRTLVEAFSRPGDLVLDPFMGSGSTLAAAAELGRRALGVDLDPEYFAIACRRMRREGRITPAALCFNSPSPPDPGEPMDQPQKAPRDLRAEITDKMIEMLEAGTAPFQKPWTPDAGLMALPYNAVSKKPYRGGNVLYLILKGMERGYSDPRWVTYKQAKDRGWQVRAGETGVPVEYWEVKSDNAAEKTPPSSDPERAEADAERKFVYKVYTVFNAEQVKDIPPIEVKRREPFESVEAGERILAASGAVIKHDQLDAAFYDRREDHIHLPRKDFFQDSMNYYRTALHELGHWTGAESRLNRLTLNEAKARGDLFYAREELIADIASLYTAIETGIPNDPRRNAEYVATWIKALKNDKNEIFRAASEASKAADYILALDKTRPPVGAREAPARQEPPAAPPPDLPESVAPAMLEGQRPHYAQRVIRQRQAVQRGRGA